MEHQRESSSLGVVTAIMEADERPAETPQTDDIPTVSATSETAVIEGSVITSPVTESAATDDSLAAPNDLDDFPEDTLVPEPVERSFPQPPERGSLEDEHLVPLVGRHTDDTATIDLIGILQAQMQLRATEAARFAAWEAEIRRIGTDEALEELEKTRLHFTGVIPIQSGPPLISVDRTPPPTTESTPTELDAHASSSKNADPRADKDAAAAELVTVDQTPTGEGLVPLRLRKTAAELPVVTAGDIPAVDDASRNVHAERARLADEELLEHGTPTSPGQPSAEAGVPARASTRILVASLSALAVVVVIAAVLVNAIGAPVTPSAALGAIAVPAAAWIGIALGRIALRTRAAAGSMSNRSSGLTLALAVVVGVVIGEGLIRTTSSAFAWQGYLLSLVQVHGVPRELSVVGGLAAALVLAFVIVVAVDGRKGPAGDRLASAPDGSATDSPGSTAARA
ncbi:hypothetical protein [Frondihabitans sp. Leaf304]|uniref:hypothetical protein n=1 Tax=Frondihabitans sp. Leaf304 TaxID=1736329 RepID=UPI0012FB5B0B|nr:hypothetical protein [Frondihabitans sp. Leaf304]